MLCPPSMASCHRRSSSPTRSATSAVETMISVLTSRFLLPPATAPCSRHVAGSRLIGSMRDGRDSFRRDPDALAAERRRFIEQIALLLEASQVVRDTSSRKIFFDTLRDALLGDLPVREVDF